MTGHRRLRSGFTLLELMVALTITGIIVLLVHQVFSIVTDSGTRLRQSTLTRDGRANARRWLQNVLLSVETGGDAGSFEGHADRMTFATWTMVPGGWMEPSRVTVQMREGRMRFAGPTFNLEYPDSVVTVAFDYLLEPGLQSRWVSEWVSPVSAPLGVRMRLSWFQARCESARHSGRPDCLMTDTVLFLIGGRG